MRAAIADGCPGGILGEQSAEARHRNNRRTTVDVDRWPWTLGQLEPALVERPALAGRLRIQCADPLHRLHDIGVFLEGLHARLGGDMLHCRPHDGASVPVNRGQNAVVVLERLGPANVLDDLEVRLAFKEALPNRASEALPLDGGESIDKGLQQLAAIRAAHAERVGEDCRPNCRGAWHCGIE
ncbi:hypothetical protein D3C78_1183210 [compost metagenome]